MASAITFCATSKSGLGHIRRLTNIGNAVRNRNPSVTLDLLTNAALAGLTEAEIALYRHIEIVERDRMADTLLARGVGGPVLVDTAVVPGLTRLPGPLCMVLRETVASRLGQFQLEGGRPWDLIMLPNPSGEWLPDPAAVSARRVEAVGWIWRAADDAEPAAGDAEAPEHPSVLLASGGGGTGETAQYVRAQVETLVRGLRRAQSGPLEIVQVVGPRSAPDVRIDEVDRDAAVTPRAAPAGLGPRPALAH